MLEKYVYKKMAKFLLGDSYESVNRVIDYSTKAFEDCHKEVLQDPFLIGIIDLLTGKYDGLVDDIISLMKDTDGNTRVSKDVLKFSLKIVDYVKEELERELELPQQI